MNDFHEIWLVHCEINRPPGERPRPNRIHAREVKSGRVIDVEHGRLRVGVSPLPLGPDDLLIAFEAPAVLGCYLSMSWTLPKQVIDLQAEFRCKVSGLDVDGDSLQKALHHFGMYGSGLDGLQQLWQALQPGL